MRRAFVMTMTAALYLTACGGSDSAESTEPSAAEVTPTENVSPAAEPADNDQTAEKRTVPAPEGSMAANAMILGDPDAPVTIIEYASVTCPGCAAFHTQILPTIKEEYVDTGKVKIEFREYPTNPQNLAYAGFYLARCSATQKGSPAYFNMLETLFERQREWAYGPTPGTVLENIAAQAGMDRAKLEECFYREDVKEAVRNNVVAGTEDDVSKTPTFIVDGEEFDWGYSIDGFREALDKKLAETQ